ncbi:MAG TPA: FapA family protein [Desulfosporosinus sp.]|nr:FapA family protein [Desulfosporosinus sp.]
MPEKDITVHLVEKTTTIWDGNKYSIALGEGVKQFRPFTKAGEVYLNGKVQDKPFETSSGDLVEYQPYSESGRLNWDLQVLFYGMSVVAKVRHEQAGHYTLPKDFSATKEIDLAQLVVWESLPAVGEFWDELRLKADLQKLKVVHGYRPGIWEEIQAVQGLGEVVIAVATPAVQTENSKLEDFVGQIQVLSAADKRVDYFASKVKIVDEGAILARKIPGKLGVPGKDVLGKAFAVAAVKDFQFRLKKNVCLSEDGLEVVAACSGQPIRIDEKTYMVENIYVLNNDVDMKTGSIEFPGNVYVNGNVQDGLRIFAGGKLEIKGSVSHAEIRAEKGTKIYQNLLGGKIVVGEKFVVRSELLRSLSELQDQLSVCLRHTAELIKSPGAINLKPGLCLKLVMEKQFPELPKLSSSLEKFIIKHKTDVMISEGLIVAVRTAKRFLTGLGPLELQSLPFLLKVNQAFEQFITNMALEIPEELSLVVHYVQGATIECGGSFVCQKGVYNSDIRVEGDVMIEGVCRGGRISAGGQVSISELGGSEVSSTFVQISPKSRLLVEYCHPNAIIAVGKEITHIEQACRKLEIYRENGQVQVEKIRANPL